MIRFTLTQLVELFRRGFALFLLAPVIVAIVVVPEFIQHVVEIRIGAFDDLESARALSDDPRRWAAGYAKLAGLAIAMLAAARFWAIRARGGIWWRLGNVAWVPLILGLLLFLGIPTLGEQSFGRVPEWAYQTIVWGLTIATLPFLITALAALFGDRRKGLFSGYWSDWRAVPLLLLLVVAAFVPAMGAHIGLHHLARGQAEPVLWALMTVDSLVVGLIASLLGAAFSLGYEAARGAQSA